MTFLLISLALAGVIYLVAASYGRKARARILRIRKVKGPPHLQVSYMNMRGKRYTWRLTIESVRPRKQDWIVTAWCHEKKDFLVFYASRMYACLDFQTREEIKNVPAYFSEKFAQKPRLQGSVSESTWDRPRRAS